VSTSTGRGSELELEHEILDALAAAGAAVPAPVAGSWELPGWAGVPFSVTTFLEGTPVDPADAIGVAPDIAGFLSTLHATAPPATTPGLTRRFRRAPIWPTHRSTLAGHPVAGDPPLRAQLETRAGDVGRASGGPVALVHSDLHEENILRTGAGAGFLDFGCAFVGSPLWDYAALAFFLGWPLGDEVIACSAGVDPHAARLVALSFALYRWAVAGDDDDETEHCAAFLRTTLTPLLGGHVQ
jgi:aminoglycoside phosphotransferase (APT) family kinase protein